MGTCLLFGNRSCVCVQIFMNIPRQTKYRSSMKCFLKCMFRSFDIQHIFINSVFITRIHGHSNTMLGMIYLNSLKPSDAYIYIYIYIACVGKLGHHCFRWWFVACTAPSHYLNTGLLLIRLVWRMNEFQWNFNRNLSIVIEENAFENVVCKMLSVLSRPQYTYILYYNRLW